MQGGGRCYRVEGDAFVALLRGDDCGPVALALAERLRFVAERGTWLPELRDPRQPLPRLTIAVVTVHGPASIEVARDAVYAGKAFGGNRVVDLVDRR